MGTYWTQDGQYQEALTTLESQIPVTGECDDPKLESLRKAINAYHDIFNNGGGNACRFEELDPTGNPKLDDLFKMLANDDLSREMNATENKIMFSFFQETDGEDLHDWEDWDEDDMDTSDGDGWELVDSIVISEQDLEDWLSQLILAAA